MIVAIIRPEKLEDVTRALNEQDVYLMTVTDVRGCGRQRGDQGRQAHLQRQAAHDAATAAESAAQQMHGCFAVQGEGCSMEPVYVSGTAVVIRAGGYDRLRRGQPVVYQSRRGMTVAHMLVRQTELGWVAAGLNNNGEDTELVTSDNLVGVITQAYASRTGSLPKTVAARIALNEQIRSGSTVASLGL